MSEPLHIEVSDLAKAQISAALAPEAEADLDAIRSIVQVGSSAGVRREAEFLSESRSERGIPGEDPTQASGLVRAMESDLRTEDGGRRKEEGS